MDNKTLGKLNDITAKETINIRTKANKEVNKIYFIEKTFSENYEILQEYMNKNNLSLKETYEHQQSLWHGLSKPVFD